MGRHAVRRGARSDQGSVAIKIATQKNNEGPSALLHFKVSRYVNTSCISSSGVLVEQRGVRSERIVDFELYGAARPRMIPAVRALIADVEPVVQQQRSLERFARRQRDGHSIRHAGRIQEMRLEIGRIVLFRDSRQIARHRMALRTSAGSIEVSLAGFDCPGREARGRECRWDSRPGSGCAGRKA